jgi:GNAT superfamily N-acetyltransferase
MAEVLRNIKDGQVQILGLKPSEISETDLDRLGLTDLLSRGYGLDISGSRLHNEVARRFQWHDDVKKLFFAVKNERVVGMIGLFRAGSLAQDLLFAGTQPLATAYGVADTMVLPEYRERGVATVLWEEAVVKLEPDVIVGQTNNPNQVLTRSNTLANLGFRTFYGKSETTPTNPQELTNEHERIRRAAIVYLGGLADETTGVWSHGLPDYFLKPVVPDLSNYPSCIQVAFAPVLTKQNRLKESSVALSSLISVRRNFLTQATQQASVSF